MRIFNPVAGALCLCYHILSRKQLTDEREDTKMTREEARENMRPVMQYMAWLMLNSFDDQDMRKAEEIKPINGEEITAKRGVYLLVRSFE